MSEVINVADAVTAPGKGGEGAERRAIADVGGLPAPYVAMMFAGIGEETQPGEEANGPPMFFRAD